MQINLNPSEEELNQVKTLKAVVDALNITGFLEPNGGIIRKSKSKDHYPKTKWAMVTSDNGFAFPVQVPISDTTKSILYTFDKKEVEFSVENACCVLAMYFFQMLQWIRRPIDEYGEGEHLAEVVYGATSDIFQDEGQFKRFNELFNEGYKYLGADPEEMDKALNVLD